MRFTLTNDDNRNKRKNMQTHSFKETDQKSNNDSNVKANGQYLLLSSNLLLLLFLKCLDGLLSLNRV